MSRYAVQYELMTPAEIVGARAAAPMAFVPIGPLEWHGPHLPLGLDGLHAHEVAVRAATDVGGVVLPTLFAGTETVRPAGTGPQSVGALGFSSDERIVGMNFPENSVNSIYFEESAFGITVRELVRGLVADGFRVVVLVNGHGAVNHQVTLRRIAVEETDASGARVVYHLVFLPIPDAEGPGHATRAETAVGMVFAPGRVQLDRLPPHDVALGYRDYGIVDAAAFDGRPAANFAVPADDDPRVATAEQGEAILRDESAALVAAVRASN
jgi:creatinine amidohydrolase